MRLSVTITDATPGDLMVVAAALLELGDEAAQVTESTRPVDPVPAVDVVPVVKRRGRPAESSPAQAEPSPEQPVEAPAAKLSEADLRAEAQTVGRRLIKAGKRDEVKATIVEHGGGAKLLQDVPADRLGAVLEALRAISVDEDDEDL